MKKPVVADQHQWFALMAAVDKYWVTHGYAPTKSELAEIMRLNRRSVAEIVSRLVEDGFMTEEPGKRRTLRVVKLLK